MPLTGFVSKVKVNCIILLFSVSWIMLAVNQYDCYNYHHYSLLDKQVNNVVINHRLNFRFNYSINVRENWSGNQEWTIQRHWQHWVHKKQDEDKQNTKTQHRKLQKMSNMDPHLNTREGLAVSASYKIPVLYFIIYIRNFSSDMTYSNIFKMSNGIVKLKGKRNLFSPW
jgi:hypothetical protein